MDRDGNLAIDVKMLYDKRTKMIADRATSGLANIEALSDEEVKSRGVSLRELDLIKKFVSFDQ